MKADVSRAVLVTGCSTGLGRAIVERLAGSKSGWIVYATARQPETIAPLLAAGCRTMTLDVCDEASMRSAVEAIERDHGAVGVLINNAGYGAEGPFEEIPMTEVRRQFETNVFGLVRLTQLVLPGMRRQGWGKVVNMSSMGGRFTLPGGTFYHATKHAVESLSDGLRFEVAKLGVDVILIEPGPIKSQFGDTAIASVRRHIRAGSAYEEFATDLVERIRGAYEGPMGRLAGTPEDVARVVEKAISARRPRARYPVTLMARLLMATRRWLPDRGFDLFLTTQFRQPRGG